MISIFHVADFARAHGRQIAQYLFMILITIRMKVAPEKRKELSQAIVSLVGLIKGVTGCHHCDFCQSLEDDEFCLLGEWESQGDLFAHLKSDLFKVLLGAMSLLKKPHEIQIYNELKSLQHADRTTEEILA